jgi:hypothetical protein
MVATDIQGKSCRRMTEALIAGERDLEVLADMACPGMHTAGQWCWRFLGWRGRARIIWRMV